jgi:hypothetical protein
MNYIEEEKVKADVYMRNAWNEVLAKKKRNWLWFVGSLIVIGLLVIAVSSLVHASPVSGDWKAHVFVNAGGSTYCWFGEKRAASDGVDLFDMPHPPLWPPGRCFVFMSEPSFPVPHNHLLYVFRHYPHTLTVWNLTLFYCPAKGQGAVVSVSWEPGELLRSEYSSVHLQSSGIDVDMLTSDRFCFFSLPYQMTFMQIIMK